MQSASFILLAGGLVALISQVSNAADTLYWEQSCPFPRQDCGVQHQPIMGSYFEKGYSYIGNDYTRVMLLDSRYAGSSAARLISPYIKSTYRQNICLTLEYLIEHEGLEKLTVIQQDRQQTKTIYQVGEEKKGKWRVAKMDIVLRGGIVRYFIEGRVKRGKSGIAMIKALEWKDGKCKPEYNREALFVRRARLLGRYFDMYDNDNTK